MAKYTMTVEVEAEQFLPEEDKIPAGVMPDGPRSPKVDPRAAWIIRTTEGMKYLNPGEYIVTLGTGEVIVMDKNSFEKTYKKK